MRAVLTGTTADVRTLLDAGDDPGAANDAGATALMWAAGDLEKTRLLLEYGADASAISNDGRTALAIASALHGGARVVSLLLDYGSNPVVNRPGATNPVLEAAFAGEAATIRLLRDAGADLKGAGAFGLGLAVHAQCAECADLLAPALDAKALSMAALVVVPPDDDGRLLRPLLARRGDVTVQDDEGRSLLLRAAATDLLPADIMKTLIDRGADARATLPGGQTAVGLARLRGNAAVIDVLKKAGAADNPAASPAIPKPSPAASARAAVERSLPLLQESDATFLRKSGCVSCHNNSLTAMTVALSRSHGIRVDEEIAQVQVETIAKFLESWRERALQGIGIPGNSDTVGYILFGLSAEGAPADAGTDAMARFVLREQTPSGFWRILAHRPPIESSDVQATALAMRSLQVYAPRYARAEYDAAVRRAAAWLSGASVVTTEDRAFQLLGLGWSAASKARIQAAARALVGEQRKDGGWAQLPALDSDAYATGQALVALEESGAMTPGDPAYKRGVQFLMNSQMADGSWYVPSRALKIQPHFESGFPYGRDQFISAAATNWATAALALTVRQ
jgi:ankyrin repeat protein